MTKGSFKLLEKIHWTKEICKLCCCLLYWCEGNKISNQVRFTSSDPSLIKLFLSLLRQGFYIDESKFRALVHLHSYHNEEKQKAFWGQVSEIPINQFYRSFHKPNTGQRIHKEYPGCLAISYYDSKVAKELLSIYNAFTQRGVR